jgi:hypothetical protein
MRHLVMAIAVLILAIPARPAHGAGSSPPQTVMPGAATVPGIHVTPAQAHPAAPPPPPAPPPSRSAGPPIVYPFPPLMSPPAGGLTPPAGGTTSRFSPRAPNRTRSSRYGQFGSPFYAPFVSGYPAAADAEAATPAAPVAAETGFLRLAVTPTAAQVFIDSFYAGTVADIDAQRVLTLDAGPHRIEIRAPQYQTLTVDVRIVPREIVTYRGALEVARPPVPATRAVSSSPMYLIPNCYVGNVPPRPGRLPAGCDIKQVQVLGPK